MLERKQTTEAFSSDRRLLRCYQLPNKNLRHISTNVKRFPRYVHISKFFVFIPRFLAESQTMLGNAALDSGHCSND